jgi:hypothetical protein
MELYRGISQQVTLDVPATASQVMASFYLDDVQVGLIVQPTVVGTLTDISVPYAAVAEEGELRVELSFMEDFSYYTNNFYYDVVTPYLSIHEIKRIVSSSMSDQEAVDLERAVRLVIDSYCGQTFGYRRKTITVRGRNDNPLRLPERLDVFEGMSASLYPAVTVTDGYLIQDDGWSLRWSYVGSQVYDQYVTTTNPIVYPYGAYERQFSDPVIYSITGYWGHRRVPEKVSEAARVLANDYACSEQMYRDRYLVSMTAADWRLQFASAAYARTGNVRADELLGDFVRTGIGVV